MPGTRGQTECQRCGTCCLKGGPALHTEDRRLVRDNFIPRQALIAVRKGEPVFRPDSPIPAPSTSEFIKLKGKAAEWACIFYEQRTASCAIYRHRPLECVLLKCWDTAELQEIAGRDLLDRFSLISPEEPVYEYIREHEKQCSLGILAGMNLGRNRKIAKDLLAELSLLVNKDLALRAKALDDLELSLDLELLYFGRPLFTILTQFSLLPREVNGNIILIQG